MKKILKGIGIVLCLSLVNPAYSMDLEQKIKDLHATLITLREKLNQLNNGLSTIKSKLLGEEPGIGEAVEQHPMIIETLQSIEAVNGQDNNLVNQNFHIAQANIERVKDIEITPAQRQDAYAKLKNMKNDIKQKYQNYLKVGDAEGNRVNHEFSSIVNQIIQQTATYENVLNEFLKKDTTSIKSSTYGHNSIQVVVEYMQKIMNENIVNANDVLNDALGSMQFRTQALILFYILLQNDFFNDSEFLTIVINALLGYIGQNGFDHLGKCVTAQLLKKIPNMTPELLTSLEQNLIGYNKKIEKLSKTNPNPTIAGKQCPQFQYYEMEFTQLGTETKANLLRYILASKAEIELLNIKKVVIQEPEPIIPHPIIVEPEPVINQLITDISDSIEMLPAIVSKAGFPVAKFKEIVLDMQTNLNRDLLNIEKAKSIDILSYFKLFTQKGHNYFMQNQQLKNTYQEMLSLCTLIIKCIFDSLMTCDAFKVEYQHLTLLITFTNFLFSIKQEDFAQLDNPAFNPATDCLKKDDLQNYIIFKQSIIKYEHNNQNMFMNLMNWFDDNQRENVNDFFTKSGMPKMGKTVVFKNVFDQLNKASKK